MKVLIRLSPGLKKGQSATNSEELVDAAHAGRVTMALTMHFSRRGVTPRRIHTVANVKLDKVGDAFAIIRVELEMEADIPGLDERAFQAIAIEAKQNYPVSKALAGAEIHLTAKLLTTAAG